MNGRESLLSTDVAMSSRVGEFIQTYSVQINLVATRYMILVQVKRFNERAEPTTAISWISNDDATPEYPENIELRKTIERTSSRHPDSEFTQNINA